MKHCVLILFLYLFAILATVASFATESAGVRAGTTVPAKQPVGIFTYEDDDKILVGIGTTKPLVAVDATRGEVKIGTTGVPCTHALAGTLRSVAARLQFCDGTSWRNVSLDKAE